MIIFTARFLFCLLQKLIKYVKIRVLKFEWKGSGFLKLIACVDDNKGLMFNKRRQSQDRVLRKRILELVGEDKLWMTPYSAKQFEAEYSVNVDDDCQSKAGKNDFYFLENGGFDIKNCQEVILYHWNRLYPADKYFDIDLSGLGFELVSKYEFEGYSHEKITEERYVKR